MEIIVFQKTYFSILQTIQQVHDKIYNKCLHLLIMKRSARDVPLQEITLRKYESPLGLEKRETARKFLLSIGLLQPGESRDILVDIFDLLLGAKKTRAELDVADFLRILKEKKGASAPNVRRQLRRLKDMKLVEKTVKGYRIKEFGNIEPILTNFIIPFVIEPSKERLIEYARELDRL